MVDEGGLQGQVSRGVEAGALVLGRFGRRLADRQQIELCVVPLVQEDLVPNFLDDNRYGHYQALQ